MGERPALAVIVRRTLLITLALSLNLAMQLSGFLATAPDERPTEMWTAVHYSVAVAFAVCAVVAWQIRDSRNAAPLMIAFVFLWIPQTIYAVIGPIGWLWPLVQGIDLTWALLAGVLVLVYPAGALVGRFDMVVIGTAVVLTALRFVAALFVNPDGPADCDCAPNPYAVTATSDLFGTIDVLYRLGGVVLVLVIAGRLLTRWVRGTLPARNIAFIMPFALLAWALTLALDALKFALGFEPPQAFAYLSLISISSIPISYVAGVAHSRNLRARVSDLMAITREGADRELWESSLARTLGDNSVRVYWWDEVRGEYRDARGALVPEDAQDSQLLRIASDDEPIATIQHDKALLTNQRLLDGVSTALRLTVDNGRLRSEIEKTLEEVRESRQRIVDAGDAARRRIERNLHDGAQQQLVVLGITLRGIETEAGQTGRTDLADRVDAAITQLNGSMAELRTLARGIHPSLLTEGGLALALPELVGRCPIPTELMLEYSERFSPLLEATVYFVVSEALANAAKHSQAHRCRVLLSRQGDVIELVVRDDGRGGVDVAAGSGVLGMADRIEAVDGTLEVRSAPGEGTTLTARLPLR